MEQSMLDILAGESPDNWWRINYTRIKNLPVPHCRPFGEFFFNHKCLWLFLHIIISSLIIESGRYLLEPLGVNWFWAPVIAFFLYPSKSAGYPLTSITLWMRERPDFMYWVNWAMGALVIPLVCWQYFEWFDDNVAHPFREIVGKLELLLMNLFARIAGMEIKGVTGQDVFLITACLVAGSLVIWNEFIRKK